MPCHRNVLDTTGTTYAHQQPRYTEGEKSEGTGRKKRREKRREQYEYSSNSIVSIYQVECLLRVGQLLMIGNEDNLRFLSIYEEV